MPNPLQNISPNKLLKFAGNIQFINIAFTLSFLYWFYLACTTQMVLVHDALGYESLGKLLYHHGWIEYFKTGPNREPLYPFMISCSMRIGNLLNISYQSVQIIFQLFFLFITQILTFRLLKQLKMSPFLIALLILYIGYSPALTNSALSLFSEIMTYPFLIGLITMTIHAWKACHNKTNFLSTRMSDSLTGMCVALLFVATTMVKGAYEFIFLIYLSPFAYLFLKSLIRKNNPVFKRTGIFLLTTILTFNLFLISYKLLNKKYNGQYTLTDRSSYVLYNSASLRTEELSLKKFFSALAYIPGENYCTIFFDEETCAFWRTKNLESFSHSPEAKNIQEKILPQEQNNAFTIVTKKKIRQHPVRFSLLMSVDAIKLFFWESTKIGFVIYPKGLEKLFSNPILKDGLRLVISLCSLFSFCYLSLFTLRNRKCLSSDDFTVACLFTLLIIIPHIGIYALCAASISRHALPLAPLYLLCIIYTLNCKLRE